MFENAKHVAASSPGWCSLATAWTNDAPRSDGRTAASRIPTQSSPALVHGYGCFPADAGHEPDDDAADGRLRSSTPGTSRRSLHERSPAAVQTEARTPRRYASSRAAQPSHEGCSYAAVQPADGWLIHAYSRQLDEHRSRTKQQHDFPKSRWTHSANSKSRKAPVPQSLRGKPVQRHI